MLLHGYVCTTSAVKLQSAIFLYLYQMFIIQFIRGSRTFLSDWGNVFYVAAVDNWIALLDEKCFVFLFDMALVTCF